MTNEERASCGGRRSSIVGFFRTSYFEHVLAAVGGRPSVVVSIHRQTRIHLYRPAIDAPFQIEQLFEAVALEEPDDVGAAAAGLALDDDLARRVQLAQMLQHLPFGDEHRAQISQIADLPFVRLAHVEDEQVVARIEAAF